MIEVRKATAEDIASIEVHPKILESDPNAKDRVALANGAYIAKYNDETLFVFGFTSMLPGVLDAWSITTPAVSKYPKAYFTVMKTILNRGIEGVHRIQATVYTDFKESAACLSRLNFSLEGTLKAYGPTKKDFYMFGRVY